jgi:hypothetical protein
VFHAKLAKGVRYAEYDMPVLQPVYEIPKALVLFSEAMGKNCRQFDAWVCFFEHDVKFERLWNCPERYLDRLGQFTGVVMPDFSLYRDLPYPERVHNVYRNKMLAAWLQSQGMPVIPNARLCGLESVGYALAGLPHGGTIAIGTHGCLKGRFDRMHFVEEVEAVVDILGPSAIVAYGSDAYGAFDYPRTQGIQVSVFPSKTAVALGRR